MQDIIAPEDFSRITLSYMQYEDAMWVRNGGTLENRFALRNPPPNVHVIGDEVFWQPSVHHSTHCYHADSAQAALAWAHKKAAQIGAAANPECTCAFCKK